MKQKSLVSCLTHLNHALGTMASLLAEYGIESERERYGEMDDFERRCFHIREYLVTALKADALHKSSMDEPRKQKKRSRKREAEIRHSLGAIRAKITALPPDCTGADREKTLAFLADIYSTYRNEQRQCLRNILIATRKAFGIPWEELRECAVAEIERSSAKFEADLQAAGERQGGHASTERTQADPCVSATGRS